MGTIVGRNCKIEVALTFAAALVPTAVTKAGPPVATLTAHGLADGAVGYWAVPGGMVELDQQAIVVDNVAANTFEMPGLDATDYSTYASASSQLFMAASWATLAEAAGWSVGGGSPAQLDDSRVLSAKQENVAGYLPAQDMTFDVRNQEVDGAAMAFIEQKAKRGLPVLMKISKGNVIYRVAYGVPSIPGEQVAAGQLATGQFGLIVKAWVVKPNV
jgi:ADP-ribose pyrophosphatase YjhB (NUDIX family)